MSISKRIADGRVSDLMAFVLALWDVADLMRWGKNSDKVEANQKLSRIIKELDLYKEEESIFIESLQIYYHFNPDEIKLSNFYNYAEKIKSGKLEETIKELKTFNNKIKEKINEYFPERVFGRSYP